MPVFKNIVTPGNQFTGTTANDGLFQIDATGGRRYQILIQSLVFHTDGAGADVTITHIDPDIAANRPVLLEPPTTATVVDMSIPGVFFLTKVSTDNTWGLSFVTTGMTGTGWLTIDYENGIPTAS